MSVGTTYTDVPSINKTAYTNFLSIAILGLWCSDTTRRRPHPDALFLLGIGSRQPIPPSLSTVDATTRERVLLDVLPMANLFLSPLQTATVPTYLFFSETNQAGELSIKLKRRNNAQTGHNNKQE
jgi:hypothetical protein